MRSSMLLAAALATLAAAKPTIPPHNPHSLPHIQPNRGRQDSNSTDPCAQVAAASIAENGNSIYMAKVPAKTAYDCLVSVPLNGTSAKALLKALPAYLEWQSTLTALKAPPAEYVAKVQPALDILGGLKLIEADIDAGKLEGEFEFGWSLYTLLQAAHDGHLSYVPDSVGGVFSWGRETPLVSVSEDGVKLPSVFAFQDILGTHFNNISYTPSPIVQINGQDATKYLEKFSQYGSLQDRDALYNNMFFNLAQVSLGSQGSATGMFTGNGRGRYVYPGPTTTFTFANGTSNTVENYARVLSSFRNIRSGADVAKQLFYYGVSGQGGMTESQKVPEPEPETSTEAEEASLNAKAAVPAGYPTPVVPGPYNIINGFFVDAPGYEDVAVLQVPNFVGDSYSERPFQKVTEDLIKAALAAGKTKLIIDLQANGGGTILQGYDMAKQLFPSMDPFGGNRLRAHESVDLIGQSFSAYSSQFERSLNNNYTIKGVQATYFDYRTDMNIDGKPFQSWKDKFGPSYVQGDKYTSVARWNLSDAYISYNSGGINITGHGPLANASKIQPFKAENIVILTDGYCASTCTIFSEFLTKQAGVKTIAMGGRSNSKQIQAIGGVKGVNNWSFSLIQSYAQQAIYLASGDNRTQLNSSVLRTNYFDNDIVYYRASNTPGLNSRDGVSKDDPFGPAVQFKYEEADCRLYYTPEMTTDASAIWKAAADTTWGGKSSKCVGAGHGYGKGRRHVEEVTTKLGRRNMHVARAASRKQLEAFEKTFELQTMCHMDGDGFMHP